MSAGSGRRDAGSLVASLRGRRIHIVGASGAEGVALLLYLAGEAGFEGVVAHDFSEDDRAFATSFRRANPALPRREREATLGRLRRLPVEFRLGVDYLRGLDEAEVVLASQNWFNYPSNLPAIPDAVAGGARLLGVVDLAMDLFGGTRVGVTGSNGKSTTTALIRHLLPAALPERPVLQGGNDRASQVTLARLEAADPAGILLWEVSNRHLRDRRVPVDVAVLTNVTHNHIEDHGSWAAYRDAKLRLLLGAPVAVLDAADPEARAALDEVRGGGSVLWIAGGRGLAREEEGAAWVEGDRVFLRRPGASEGVEVADAGALRLPGAHNRRNLLLALCACAAVGAPDERLAAGLPAFGGLSGRLELVGEADGVRWIWDIQATTAPAAEAGIRAEGAGRPLVLLVGGEDKGMDFRGMAEAAAEHAVAVLALPGTGTEAFLAVLGDRVPVEHFEALDPALARARTLAPAGGSVLCSPGCAFFMSRFVEPGLPYARRVRDLLASA